ncbi:hypothetical protein Hhel01_04252 [Haloferula helveola]
MLADSYRSSLLVHEVIRPDERIAAKVQRRIAGESNFWANV